MEPELRNAMSMLPRLDYRSGGCSIRNESVRSAIDFAETLIR